MNILIILITIFSNFVVKTVFSDCPGPILKEGVEYICQQYYKGPLINCELDPITGGTRIEYQCKDYYIPNANKRQLPLTMHCAANGYLYGIQVHNRFFCSIDCGRPKVSQPHVIGGNEVNPILWPWHASIFAKQTKRPNSSYRYICGGSLIKPDTSGLVIVTAAHCFSNGKNVLRDQDSYSYKVVLGGNSSILDDSLKNPYSEEFNVKEIKLHESYQDRTYQSDIALLLLDKPITLTPNILPVCLGYSNQYVRKNEHGFVVGFGRDNLESLKTSVSLKKVKLPVVDPNLCAEWREVKIHQSEICAGAEAGVSTCEEDSGGGFVFKDARDPYSPYILEGIVSHGRRHSDSNRPACDHYSVFTRVANYVQWINEKAKTLKHKASDAFLSTNRHGLPNDQPQNSQPAPQNLILVPEFRIVGLERINHWRITNKVPKVVLNAQLNEAAQAHAEYLANNNLFRKAKGTTYGQTIYQGTGVKSTYKPASCVYDAVDYWYYDSINRINLNNPIQSRKLPIHQLISPEAREVGIGYARNGDRIVVVATYYPPLTS